ncbi:hypothetical protein [Roseovarius sp. 2305UL8-3]|uniref:hypothetical protein n=1 Tax=Roseovarius conchicola TaxID=3121636 RepID=UPI00352900A6
MVSNVAIARRFARADKQELRDPDYLSYFGSEPDGVYKWPDLYEQTPLVVLGEGRSGKTYEFERQVDLLRKSGSFAFFIPLELLHDENFEDALTEKDAVAFEAWKGSPTATAYFFLDALDELKLREGSLRTAVRKLHSACEPHFARMNLVLSCRPADWQSQIDSQQLEPFCVARNSFSPASELRNNPEAVGQSDGSHSNPFGSLRRTAGRLFIGLKRAFSSRGSNRNDEEDHGSEAYFLQVVSKSGSVQGKVGTETEPENKNENISPFIVTLLPLSQGEVRDFAQNYSPNFADVFCTHLEAHDFWHLYRLPAEIINALDQLVTGVPLGSLEDQLKLGIQRKLREEQPNKPRALSAEKAQHGAERIALAMFLLKRRTLNVEKSDSPDALDVGDILTDWTPDQQKELIGKTLFDPSGIGSVRFHHRSTQEYLAAMRLHRLREDGMHERDIFALLFGEIGGEAVVKPSIAPVAAWLALWHADIRRDLLEREPGLLFQQGLPSALSMDIRAEVLREYTLQYSGKGWCRSGIGHQELRRVAHPSLGAVVRELWVDACTGHDSMELLLEMIWLGPMPDCADLALTAALDQNLDAYHRIYASRGVLVAGTSDQKRTLAEAVSNRVLPQRVIRNILPEMVPNLINSEAFLTLIDGLDVVPNSVHGLNYAIYQTVKNDQLSQEEQAVLRDRLADGIWASRRDDCRMYQAHAEKDHYQDGLIACCQTTVPIQTEDPSAWARALSIAIHFGERHESIIAEKESKAVWSELGANSRLREAYFWACLQLADEMEGHEDDWPRFIRATSDSRRSLRYDTSDQAWLLEAVAPAADRNRRGVAFHAITQFFDIKEDQPLSEKLLNRVEDRQDWTETIHRILNPQPRELDEFDLEMRAHDAERETEEAQRVAGWLEWRSEVLNDPDYLLGGERRLGVLYDAKKVISQAVDKDSTWGHWDGATIARTLGEDFLECYRRELSVFWRATDVQLRSERVLEQRNSYPHSWLLALAAVKSEAETIGWATSLSYDEAVRAARIACIELNGFGGYMATLDEAHPQAVADVVAGEAFAQLGQLEEVGQAEMFHDVLYSGTGNMKAALAFRVAPHVADFVSAEQDGAKNALEYAVRIIAEDGNPDTYALAVSSLEQQLEQDAILPADFVLSLLAMLDPETGCQRLLLETENLDTAEKRENAINAFANVFGDRHTRRVPDLAKIPEERRVPLLRNLVLRVYQAVRREDDVEHEGTYTPDLRDNAQDARSFLLESLLNTKLPETLAVIHELAEQPEFAHMPDRLRQMAYEIAAQMSDVTPHPLTAFQAMDREGAFIPFDNRSLLTAMMTRLDSFEHDVLHADDTPIEALRRLDQETDLRRFIANWLRGRDRGVFDFTQEAVVIDENRTDIRFHPHAMQGYATVELKRETWSVRQLEEALVNQLVGQYLQHEMCRTGCLLICQANGKRWRHPDTNAWMSLPEVVSHLNSIARQIMTARPELHLAVKGVDYS